MTASETPLGWETLPLAQLAHLERGKFSARPRNDPRYYGGDIPFIQTGDVRSSGGLITSYTQTLNADGLRVSKLFPAGTLFLTIAANIGDLGISQFACACPDSLVAIRAKSRVSKAWLGYALSARKKVLESLATQNAQLNLNLAKLNPFHLLVPPYEDQHRIAEALGDADAHIRALDRLIAKKQAIRRGLMQQLLFGRTRPCCADAPWVERRIGDLASVTKGEQLGRSGMNALCTIPVWNGGVEPSGFTDQPNVAHPVVTVSEGGNSCGWVGRPDGSFWLGGHCYALEPTDSTYSVSFLYYTLKARESDLMSLRVGSGLPNIQKRRLSDFALRVPTDPLEAKAISAILDDVTRQISVLRSKLKKARAIKSGMTQELLTGHKRLPLEAGS